MKGELADAGDAAIGFLVEPDGIEGERVMATRGGGKSENRSNARSASGASASSGAARQSTGGTSATSAPSSNAGAAGARSASPTPSGSTSAASSNATSQRDSNANASTAATGGDRERELNKSREQGSVRPSSSTRRQEAGQQTTGAYTSPIYSTGGSSPFAMMRRMMEDMDRLFSDFGFTHPGLLASSLLNPDAWSADESRQRSLGGQTQSGGTGGALAPQTRGQQGLQRGGQRALSTSALQSIWAPQVEIFERGNSLVVRADLPGLSREDVDVEVEDDALVIRGERHSDVEDEQEGYYRSERSYGSFYRAIPLPDGVDASACNATFKDGVLEVTLPKPAQQPSRARRIDVR